MGCGCRENSSFACPVTALYSMAQSTLYFENNLATISEHPDGYVVFVYRKAKRNVADLKAVLTHTRNLLYRRRWHRILADQRLMEAITPEESAFVAEFWQQETQVLGHGICVASVLAQDVFARLAAAQLRTELGTAHVGYRVFDDEATASAWLREQMVRPPLK